MLRGRCVQSSAREAVPRQQARAPALLLCQPFPFRVENHARIVAHGRGAAAGNRPTPKRRDGRRAAGLCHVGWRVPRRRFGFAESLRTAVSSAPARRARRRAGVSWHETNEINVGPERAGTALSRQLWRRHIACSCTHSRPIRASETGPTFCERMAWRPDYAAWQAGCARSCARTRTTHHARPVKPQGGRGSRGDLLLQPRWDCAHHGHRRRTGQPAARRPLPAARRLPPAWRHRMSLSGSNLLQVTLAALRTDRAAGAALHLPPPASRQEQ